MPLVSGIPDTWLVVIIIDIMIFCATYLFTSINYRGAPNAIRKSFAWGAGAAVMACAVMAAFVFFHPVFRELTDPHLDKVICATFEPSPDEPNKFVGADCEVVFND